MSTAGQAIEEENNNRGRLQRLLRIAVVVRFLAVTGVAVTALVPGLRPIDLPVFFAVVALEIIANSVYFLFGFKRWPSAAFHFSGLVDVLAIGVLVALTGGPDSPFVSLFTLVIAFNGFAYGWIGLMSSALPSFMGLVAVSIASSTGVDYAALAVTLGVFSGLAFLSGWLGEEEKGSRRDLREEARLNTTHAHQMQALYETSTIISTQVEAEGLLTIAVERIQELAKEMTGEGVVTSISLVDWGAGEATIVRVVGEEHHVAAHTSIKLSDLHPDLVELTKEVHPFVLEGERLGDLNAFFQLPKSARVAIIPIRLGDDHLGVISIRSTHGAVPTADQFDLLETIANHLASSLFRVRALDSEKTRREQATRLFELARDLNRLEEVGPALERIAETAVEIAQVDGCAIGLMTEDGQGLAPVAWWVAGSAPHSDALTRLGPYPVTDIQVVFLESRPVELHDLDQVSEPTRDALSLLGIKSLLAFPMSSHSDGPMGSLIFGSKLSGYKFTIAQWQLGEAIAGLTAVAVENLRLLEHERGRVEELKQLDKLKTEFVATASHELRSPLTSISGFANTLLRRGVKFTEDERREFLQVIDQQAKQLARLIDELMTVSRIEEGRLALSLQRVDLTTMVLNIVTAVKVRTENHIFDLNFSEDLPPIVADENKLNEIITNLVENAMKYSPEGGKISVGARFIDHEFRILVGDEGVGIAEEDMNKIFDRFYQVEGRPPAPGSGLGLYIVAQLVKAHDGRIWVESEPGMGAIFHVAFPQRRATDRIAVA